MVAEEEPSRLERIYRRVAPPPHPVSLSPQLLVLAPLVYAVLYFAIGSDFLPGHAAFATLLIWIAAVAAADIAAWARLPRVVGMLLGGLLLGNVPGSPLAAFPPVWGAQMRAAGLATIYLRCGLVLEWKTMSQYKVPAIKLAMVPGLVEMCFDAAVAVAVFGMPWLLALTLGSLLQAVGPALLVPLLFSFQQQRIGTHEGTPQTAIVSASFDDIVAITWFSVFSSMAITGEGNIAWQIARGPVQVVLGVAAGAVAGAALAPTKLWDTQHKRLIATYAACLCIMFALVHFDMLSGGALGSLVMGMVAAAAWRQGWPARPPLSAGPAPHIADDLDASVETIWDWIAEPIVFGTIGASIDFAVLPASVVGRSVLIVCTGLVVRMVATYLTMFGCGSCGANGGWGDSAYSHRSRLFFAIAWTPKATVQAALSGVPLHLVRVLKQGSPDYKRWEEWGHQVQATGVICVLICATVGTLMVQLFGPRLLDKAPNAEDEKEHIAEVAAKHEVASLSDPRSFLGSALPSLAIQYMNLVSVLKQQHHAAGHPSPRTPRHVGHALSSSGGGGAGGGGTTGLLSPVSSSAAVSPAASAGGGGPKVSTDEVFEALSRLEEHMKQAIGRHPLTAWRALELESVALHEAGGARFSSDGGGGAGGAPVRRPRRRSSTSLPPV